MISIPLFVTETHNCSYLPGKTAQTAFVYPSYPVTNNIYSVLIEQGFRRSGNEIYTTHCGDCQQCVPVRIPIKDFRPNRRQKRCKKKNLGTTATIKPATFDKRHYDLYLRYQQHRHSDSSMANSSPEEYIQFLGSSWCNTLFVEFSIEGSLAAVAVVDLLDNALSAVYTFFDPDLTNFSLGTNAVLWQIDHAHALGLEYLYLGYWIKDCRKMNYKAEFQPLFGFINQQWKQIVI